MMKKLDVNIIQVDGKLVGESEILTNFPIVDNMFSRWKCFKK
jgi:hypothetical protein